MLSNQLCGTHILIMVFSWLNGINDYVFSSLFLIPVYDLKRSILWEPYVCISPCFIESIDAGHTIQDKLL
jgi:hypothetical protein